MCRDRDHLKFHSNQKDIQPERPESISLSTTITNLYGVKDDFHIWLLSTRQKIMQKCECAKLL